ncbi:MAG: chemotaxis protein CheW [Cyanobacteria bacterium P01_D01_bin.1]
MNVLNQTAFTLPTLSESADSDSKAYKYITFRLSDYLFALPSEDILKIVATPPPSQGGMVSMGLVQLGQYSIQILDLSKILSLESVDAPKDNESKSLLYSSESVDVDSIQNPPFLMVLRSADETLWGIAVHEPPDLVEISPQALSPVPPEQRAFGTLQGVSYVATSDLEGDRHTLLILDMATLLTQRQINIPTSSLFTAIEPSVEAKSSLEIESLEIEPPMETESSAETDALSGLVHVNGNDEYIEDLLPQTL